MLSRQEGPKRSSRPSPRSHAIAQPDWPSLTEVTFVNHYERLAALAVANRLPAISGNNLFPERGGLISYGADRIDGYRRAAELIDKILKGAKPADLPVEQPTKFELVVNLKTAKALGLTMPPEIVVRATRVIQ